MIGYQLQLFNNFDDFVTFPPPIGDQFVQQDRRKIYSGNVSYMMPSNPFGFDTKNTIGFQTRTDDIHIDLAETTGRVVRYMVRDDHVIESSAGVYFENRVQWADKFRTMTSVPMALAAPTSDSLPYAGVAWATCRCRVQHPSVGGGMGSDFRSRTSAPQAQDSWY